MFHSGFLEAVQKVSGRLRRLPLSSIFDEPFQDANGIAVDELSSQAGANAKLNQVRLDSLDSHPVPVPFLYLHCFYKVITISGHWCNIGFGVRIEIIGAESLGVRGLCCVVETDGRKVVIDPGVALGYRRHGLLPHPVQVAASERVKAAIGRALEDATDVVISHYHGEHHPMVNANPYQLSVGRVAQSLSHPRLWAKGTQDLSPNQVYRAQALAQKIDRNLTASEGLTDGPLSFSPPVPHGERGRGGTVMMTRIEEGKEVFVHASDIQMLSNEAIEQILAWHPGVVLASGPPIYLPSLTPAQREAALRRTLMLARRIDRLILDHHLMRSEEGERWLDRVSSLTEHKLICAADFMGQDRNLLEAERVRWYKKMPVPQGWHEAYARGEANTRDYRIVERLP